jgi:hypothetical protein
MEASKRLAFQKVVLREILVPAIVAVVRNGFATMPIPGLSSEGFLLSEAMLALGRLDGLATILPDAALFIYAYVRKEAVLSSQIEGTQSSLDDLLLFESDASASKELN